MQPLFAIDIKTHQKRFDPLEYSKNNKNLMRNLVVKTLFSILKSLMNF